MHSNFWIVHERATYSDSDVDLVTVGWITAWDNTVPHPLMRIEIPVVERIGLSPVEGIPAKSASEKASMVSLS